jgi:hypothetical protein
MSRRQRIWTLGMLACALSGAWAQDSSTPPASEAAPQAGQQPTPAEGPALPPITENPPLSGLDLPSLEPHGAPLSYLQLGATVSESADSNLANTLGGTGSFESISRALASATLQRLWSHYDLAVDYIGGVGYYNLKGEGFRALQQMDLDQKVTWKRGQLSLRDSFSYLPEGNFGGAYGSLGSQGIESIGNTAFGTFLAGSALGTLGLAQRIVNVSLADVSESITPKTTLTAAAGYGLTHFYGDNTETGGAFINSSQTSAQVGYDRLLSAHTQVALLYGYQGFDFSAVGAAFHSHIIQVMYGHRISGRMDFLIGAGPQFTFLNLCPFFNAGQCILPTIPDTRIGVSGRARLRYKFPRTLLDLSYERFETSGSGFFAGAQSDVVRLSADRPLSRVWGAMADIGYAHNNRLESLTQAQITSCVLPGQPNPNQLPPCPGVDANTFDYGFAGVALHRAFGREFHAFVSYQFNELSFDHSYCGGLPECSRVSNRHVVTVGLDWTPRPMRID